MCGIVGAAAKRPIAECLMDGLKQLEYRGYDSAGIALLDNQTISRYRIAGKVQKLAGILQHESLPQTTGIAHTRWATHGIPSEHNAHPFISHDTIALVHNGIIENHLSLRESLLKAGYTFTSETDTEVALHLIHSYYQKTHQLVDAILQATAVLEGAYAFCLISTDYPNTLFAVRKGSPLVIGRGKQENFIASDPLALLSVAEDFIYLEDKDIAIITENTITIYDASRTMIERPAHRLNMQAESVLRGEYKHYMKKEIMEQPEAVLAAYQGRTATLPALLPEHITQQTIQHLTFVACGTSYHAALVARYWVEAIAKIPCTVEIASEFRYRTIAPPQNSLFIALSQSGETADTLAALRLAKTMPYLETLAICNVKGSSLNREAGYTLFTHAGIEIGVASTKAFTTQLIVLLLLASRLGEKSIAHDHLLAAIETCPTLIREILKQDAQIAEIATHFTHKSHAIFLGRGALYPIALEGALKMKEISYIHAEGYPAGELKHGPLALIEKTMPVVSLIPGDHLLEKNLSNLAEVRARGSDPIILSDCEHIKPAILLPKTHPILMPLLYTIPLQLLAYHVAILKGTDVDQPRNLAKSVTVE